MTSAPRILGLTPAATCPVPMRGLRSLGFTAVAVTDPDWATEPHLIDETRKAGLALITALQPDEAAARERIRHDLDRGVPGFLATAAHRVEPEAWRGLIADARARAPDCLFGAEMLGAPASAALPLRGVGFDYLLNSLRWWDGAAPWFFDQQAIMRDIAESIAFPEPPGAAASDDAADPYHRRLVLAAALSSGLLVNADALEQPDRRDLIARTNELKTLSPALAEDGPMLRLSEAGAPVTVILRESLARDDAVLILVNVTRAAQEVDLDAWLGRLDGMGREFRELTPGVEGANAPVALVPSPLTLDGLAIRLFLARPAPSLIVPGADLPAAAGVPRIVIERVEPELDCGQFPVKRVVGDRLEVAADIFRDGHDKISAALWLQPQGAGEWHVTPMRFWDNDRWVGAAPLDRIGETRFAVASWTDPFASWRDEVGKKLAAGARLDLELIEGEHLLAEAIGRAAGAERERLEAVRDEAARLDGPAARIPFLLSNRVAHAMARVPDALDRMFQAEPGPVRVDREAARCSAWYGMFPRSQGTEPGKPASFQDCIRRLPEIRAMGFDVVYLVPIHPIGTVNRKGKNNSTVAQPGEPGSPYAIGSKLGGHTAIDPELGTIEDFRAFGRAAREHGMELALDFAIQCAPDHPWLKEHPGWFKRRPDGSIKFAENPPKKYEDIVNVDFDQPDWPALWAALLDVVRFWVAEGVKIFRVDNPHTKPLPFWQWMIGDIRGRHPDVIFLAEAFTRPKVMYRLAKIGFAQSYTYFTWRNTKQEITEYLTELSAPPVREFFRPNFFVNTPDINPIPLQTSGRPGFLIRAALACTLSGLWGMYSGFELCEAAPLPGREEYLDSEKYQIRVRDFAAPGNIVEEITALNRIRKANPALQSHLGITFYPAFNDQILLYGKRTPDGRDMILIAINLDPHNPQEAAIEIPLWEWGLPDHEALAATDLMRGQRFVWTGKNQRIRLDPADLPFAIWQIAPAGAV